MFWTSSQRSARYSRVDLGQLIFIYYVLPLIVLQSAGDADSIPVLPLIAIIYFIGGSHTTN